MASHGAEETERLKTNVQEQLNRAFAFTATKVERNSFRLLTTPQVY